MLVAVLALLAAATTAAPMPARPPTEVSPLTVYPPTPPPKLVASYPPAGGAIGPGVVVLKFTFDQNMLPTGFDLTPVAEVATAGPPAGIPVAGLSAPDVPVAGAPAGAEPPPCLKTPRLLDDARTFVLLCTLRAGRSYALALNAGPAAEGRNFGFANVYERRALPTSLAFTTTHDEPVRSLDAAMKRQGLTPLDVPVQDDPVTRPQPPVQP